MKKRTYIKPATVSIGIEAERMMALSLSINDNGQDNEIDTPDAAWSQRKSPWDDNSWNE